MKTAREVAHELMALVEDGGDPLGIVERRDAEIRAEEHEARAALFALERAAHKKELREVRAATLREVAWRVDGHGYVEASKELREMADEEERGE
jgi:hypothetical protein